MVTMPLANPPFPAPITAQSHSRVLLPGPVHYKGVSPMITNGRYIARYEH